MKVKIWLNINIGTIYHSDDDFVLNFAVVNDLEVTKTQMKKKAREERLIY